MVASLFWCASLGHLSMLVLPPVLFTRLARDSGPFHLLRGPGRSVSESANFRFAGQHGNYPKMGFSDSRSDAQVLINGVLEVRLQRPDSLGRITG